MLDVLDKELEKRGHRFVRAHLAATERARFRPAKGPALPKGAETQLQRPRMGRKDFKVIAITRD